jgi:hypothetical protein
MFQISPLQTKFSNPLVDADQISQQNGSAIIASLKLAMNPRFDFQQIPAGLAPLLERHAKESADGKARTEKHKRSMRSEV